MPERHGARFLFVLALALCESSAAAQGRRNDELFPDFPGPPGFPGDRDRRRQPTESQWNLPEPDKRPAPPDDSFFETMVPGKTPVPLGPGKRRGKGKLGALPPGAARPDARKAAPTAPPDPMKAADQVTAIADHLARLDESRQARLREHFAVCDLDENGWLSLREAEVTLAFQRAEFRRADADQDGRVDVAEFAAQQDLVLARLGVQAPPSLSVSATDAGPEPLAEPPLDPPPETVAAPVAPDAAPPASGSELSGLEPRPADLVTRYDGNASAALDAAEVERFLGDAGLTLVPDLVVDLYDRDDSGALEAAELYPLAWMASKRLSPAPDETPDAAEPAPAGPSASTLQRLTHFGRLDPDGDGFVTETELRKLQSPARLELRLRALLSGMDQDGDGRLSEAEYRASMGDARR